MKLDAAQRIVEISYDDFRRIGGLKKTETGYVGAYHSKTGRIFLVKDEWCFSNVIHEALHSRSSFSKEECSSNMKFVFEGITELLVGIVLKRSIRQCYEEWQQTNSCFLLPYMEYLKPWYYLSRKIDFAHVISLYFDVNEQSPLKKLGQILQTLAGGDLETVFSDNHKKDNSLFQIFKDELGEIYRKDFAEFQGSVIENINLKHL